MNKPFATTMVRLAKIVLPIGWARMQLTGAYQRFVLARALRELVKRPWSVLDKKKDLLQRLAYGWGNEGWSASDEYLIASIDELARTEGPVLECGSGLSTIILGVIAQKMGRQVWTLEHSEPWGSKVLRTLGKLQITAVQLHVKPLRSYGAYSWYDPPLDAMPHGFGLVICDGPPGGGHGGRYGLLPVMRHRLAIHCTVLLDDTVRVEEREIAERWSRALGAPIQYFGDDSKFAVIRIGQKKPVAGAMVGKQPPAATQFGKKEAR